MKTNPVLNVVGIALAVGLMGGLIIYKSAADYKGRASIQPRPVIIPEIVVPIEERNGWGDCPTVYRVFKSRVRYPDGTPVDTETLITKGLPRCTYA